MPDTGPQDWDSYLAMLDLSNPTLAAYLRQSLGGLVNSVPPAGQYVTSTDYTTLRPALTAQYVTEVLQKYQSILGDAPELVQAAVAAGFITREQAAAMMSATQTNVGTLQQRFARQGGLRAVQGPYEAERTQLLQQAFADMQMAAQKASEDAYKLATATTAQRVTALSNAGQLGLGLTNAGVGRRNAQTAADASRDVAEANRNGPLDVPAPPNAPGQPSTWEKLALAGIPALLTGGLALLGRNAAGGAKTPEERAQEEERYRAERTRLDESRVTPEDRASEERAPGYQGQPDLTTANPYGATTAQYGETPFGGGQAQGPEMGWAQPSFSWDQPLNFGNTPNYQQYADYSSYQDPMYADQGAYTGGYGAYPDYTPNYAPDYSSDYSWDPSSYDYNYDYSYTPDTYYPSYDDYGSYAY